MSNRILKPARWAFWGLTLGLVALGPLACRSLPDEEECLPPLADCVQPGKTCHDPTMFNLARDLDKLEKYIEWHGSAVAKQPDVYGEARLTRYREEFEKVMAKDAEDFELYLSGSVARSDQLFFAQASAISAAASSSRRSRAGPVVNNNVEAAAAVDEDAPPVPELDKPKDLLIGAEDPRLARSGVTLTPAAFGGNLAQTTIGVEPTEVLIQKARYLKALNQIRRTSEGDDTADSPGYSLNLVRVPVSILPGTYTDKGFGAEVTMTISPVLSEALLPTTFRNLVTNDLVIQFGFPLTRFLDNRQLVNQFLKNDEARKYLRGLPLRSRLLDLLRQPGQQNFDRLEAYVRSLSQPDLERLVAAVPDPLIVNRVAGPACQAVILARAYLHDIYKCPPAQAAAIRAHYLAPLTAAGFGADGFSSLSRGLAGPVRFTGFQFNDFKDAFVPPSLSFSSGLSNKLPVPTSQILDVYGDEHGLEIALGAYRALGRSLKDKGYAHLPDVQGFLKEEIDAAFEFLRRPQAQALWAEFCTPQLVNAVRARRVADLEAMQEAYRARVAAITGSDAYRSQEGRPELEPAEFSVTAALAWAVLVDSALLNDRLLRDMRDTSARKGCPLACDGWQPYYLPGPPPESRRAFNDYVKCRWPMIVFALDPEVEGQNIADSLSTRRELQLAASVAFASGRMSRRRLTQFARRLEAEYQTVALNRKQVGFSHAENVFGWRFYPRFQTPETPSNLTALVRDTFIGGPSRDALLRQRRLEPGPRDCVAVVLMPAFIPYADLDIVTNWFSLANPKRKRADHTFALRLSRRVQALKNCGHSVRDADCFRPGELNRLLRRVEQLEARLPLQTQRFQVPVLNTLGGFELFSNGTTDLAPELYGWYGAPGVFTKGKSSLFLVGDHFSVHQTEVIIGNLRAEKFLLSRQVMRVEIDAGKEGDFRTVTTERGTFVEAQVATPYGVTRELLIPVGDAAGPPLPGVAPPAEVTPPPAEKE